MKHSKKILALVLSVAVVASIAAAGTLAWLSDNSGTVTNTFAVGTQGKVGIILDEAVLDANTERAEGDREGRTSLGNDYTDIVPGKALEKDPTVVVSADSVESILYVAVKDTFGTVGDTDEPVAAWSIADGWEVAVQKNTDGVTIYKHTENVIANDEIVVFDGVTISGNLDNDTLEAAIEGKTIQIAAFAVQADNITAEAAATAATTFFATAF